MSDRLTAEQWAEQRKRKNAKRKSERLRKKAFRELAEANDGLRGMGEEIEPTEYDNVLSHGVGGEIIDAEVVSVENDGETTDVGNESTENDPSYRTAMVRWRPTQYSAEWWEQTSPEVQAKRCKAKNSRGQRCQRISIEGARVCYMHGGAAGHVKRAAMARLENASDRMARNLLGLADDAESENVRLSATNSALDRVGIKSATEVVVSAGQQSGFDEVLEDLEFTTMTREESRARRGYPDVPIDSSSFNSVDYQHDSAPAPADEREQPESADRHSDYDRPASTQSDDNPRRRRQYRPAHITGDMAYQVANETAARMGTLRAIESPHKRYPAP